MPTPDTLTPDQIRQELQQRWAALCAALNIEHPGAPNIGHQLIKAWARWPRHYHAHRHLLACLRATDEVADQAEQPGAVRWALWFHDAVYWPWSRQNERRSADWARQAALDCGLSPDFAHRVDQLVMVTAHGAPAAETATGIDADLVVDIDLGVLGQSPAVYARYVADVRREYFWVLPKAWRHGRAKVLRHFETQPVLYRTPYFRNRLEQAARANLRSELMRLEAGPGA